MIKNKLIGGMNKTSCKSLFSLAIKIYWVKSTTENCYFWQLPDFIEKIGVYMPCKEEAESEQVKAECLSPVLCWVRYQKHKWRTNPVSDI